MKITMVDLHGQYERIREEINNAIQEVLDTTAFINGPQVKTFAQHLAEYNQVEHVVPCANGTDALQIALMALGLQPGDEVIVPVHTYVATAEVIALLRLEPIFVDCVADRFTIDVTKIEEKITPRTWDIVPDGDDAEIEVYMAGGGCTLPGRSKVLMPSEGYEGVVKFVFENISTLAVNACPPVLVGVGIATSVETAAVLSRKAILRPIGSRHPNPKAAELELRLEEGLNRLGIGPQGLTGNSSVMGVHIESAARHPSTIGVAVSTGCWAHRRGTLRVHADLTFENLSHTRSAL